jgi:hypothetical protein
MYNNNLRNEVKESNRYFLDEILQTTYAYRKQMDLKIEKQLISKKVELDAQLNSVFGQVIYNWKMKVRNCALKGKNFANLFFFNKPEESDLFFIKNELYEKMQLEPPFLRLEAFFKDFGFEFKLLRKNGILLAQISWEKYFEEEKISVIQDVDIEI